MLLLDSEPIKAGIDPFNLLIDKEVSDNLKEVSEREELNFGVINSISSM